MVVDWMEALDRLRRAALEVGVEPRDVEVQVPPELFAQFKHELSIARLSTDGDSFRWREVLVKSY